MTTEHISETGRLTRNPKFWIGIASAILFFLLALLVFLVLIPEIKASRAAARKSTVKNNLRHAVPIHSPEITFHVNGSAESTFWQPGMYYPEFDSFAFINDSGSAISKEEIPEFVLHELEKEFERLDKSNHPLVNLHLKFGPSEEEVMNESTDSFWENYQQLISNETVKSEESDMSE
ncbi:MAG: hypothetical protein HUJ26_19175 [Planctomycetaceae bacterium]|nr:hypothetical protein [Planctomycetaceae bacterium]